MWISSDPQEVNLVEAPLAYRTNVTTFVTNNPSYTHKFWNISSFASLLSSEALLEPFRPIWYSLTNDFSKYMFALYCIMYVQGGLYLRLDKVCLQSLDNLLSNRSNIIVFTNSSGVDVSQLGCLASSPLMRKVVEQFALNINLTGSDHVRFGGHMVYNVLGSNPSLFNTSVDPVPLAVLSLYLTTNNTPVVVPRHHPDEHRCEEETWDVSMTVLGGLLLAGLVGIVVVYAFRQNKDYKRPAMK